jgi:hypothetical protein
LVLPRATRESERSRLDRADHRRFFCSYKLLDRRLFCSYKQPMEIVWDEPKRLANLDKHGLDFADLDETF